LSLWKYSFELVTKELDLAKKKKQALDNLFKDRKISEATYNQLSSEMEETISQIEDNLKILMDRMTLRTQELEKQISTLELFLASLEIRHAAGDLNDETYEKQNNAILLGLEATKQELQEIRDYSQKIVSKPTEISASKKEELPETVTEFSMVEESSEACEYEKAKDEESAVQELTEPQVLSQEPLQKNSVIECAESEVQSSEQPAEEAQ